MSWESNFKKRIENNKTKSRQQLLLFDSDKIDILSYAKITNDKGITINGWKIIEKDYICDMNDFDDKKNKEVWGYDVSVEKTLICRPNENITESSLIRYEDTYYKIKKIRKCKNTTIDNWDAYYKMALSKNEQQNIKIVGDIVPLTVYYGTIDASIETPTEAQVKALQNNTLKDVKGLVYSNITMDYSKIVYAYPQSFGALTSIKDEVNNYIYTESFSRLSATINNIPYYIYIQTDASASDNVELTFA